jgi:hypothetical protein
MARKPSVSYFFHRSISEADSSSAAVLPSRHSFGRASRGKMDCVITIEHIRQHVIEDVADLMSLVGLLEPVITLPRLKQADDIAHSGRLLRKILSRDVILILCRLHESADQKGSTGITASIDSLLDFASADIGVQRTAELKERRMRIIADLEAQGTKFKDVRTFRTAAIAHSLHRQSRESDTSLYYHSIAQFATATYNLVLEIEQELAVIGLTPFSDLRDSVEAWSRRGSTFWNKALNPWTLLLGGERPRISFHSIRATLLAAEPCDPLRRCRNSERHKSRRRKSVISPKTWALHPDQRG